MDKAVAEADLNSNRLTIFKPASRNELDLLLDREDVDYENIVVSLITDMSYLFYKDESSS